LKTFNGVDATGAGRLAPALLKPALEADGVKLLASEFSRLLAEAEIDTHGNAHVSFPQFSELAKTYFASQVKSKSKVVRIPRAYLSPEDSQRYAEIFRKQF
jgi:hypothetical protein